MKVDKLKMAVLFALLVLAGACSSDDDTQPVDEDPDTEEPEKTGYFIGFRTSTDPIADYLLNVDSINGGKISASGNGIEQGGWSYYTKAGDTYMAMDYTNSIATGYRMNADKELKKAGQFAFERMDLFGEAPDGKAIAIGAPWGGGSRVSQIQIIDGATVSISKKLDTEIDTVYHGETRLNVWPTATWVDGDKLYITYYPVVGDESWETPETDKAYVCVYSYPGLQYQMTFTDDRTSPIGYYSSQPCALKDEDGNRYMLSSSSIAAGYTQSTKPSGILKINKGATSFDEDYFFNVEELGYRVMGGAYVGNGMVVARVISAALDNTLPPWAAFSVADAPIHNIAVLDLNKKTLKVIEEIPMHGGQYLTPFLIENGKVWASITVNASDAYVWQIDPATAKGTKGARIDGTEIQAFYKY